MLIKLNEGEGLTVQANHSVESNSYVVSNFDGKTLYLRDFPSGDIPPKPVQGDSKNSVQQLKAEICAEMREHLEFHRINIHEVDRKAIAEWERKLSSVE